MESGFTAKGKTENRAISSTSEGTEPELVMDPMIDRFDLSYLIREYWWKILLGPVLIGALALGLSFTRQPLYESVAVILVDPSYEKIIQIEDVDGDRDDLTGLRSLERAIVAESVILRVVDALDLRNQEGFLPEELAEKPDLSDAELVAFLQENRIGATLVPETRLIRIRVMDPSPERAQRIAAALTTEFEAFVSDQRRDEVARAQASVEKQAIEARKRALKSEERLKEFRLSHPAFPVEQDHDLFSARLTQLGQELNTVNQERRQLESQKGVLDQIDPAASPLEVIEVAGYGQVAHVSELMTAIAASRARATALGEEFQGAHPALRAAQAETRRNEEQLRELAESIRSAVGAKFLSAKSREELLEQELASLVADLGEMKSVSSEFRALQQQSERDWQIHQALQDQFSESAAAVEMAGQLATVVTRPLLPYKKAKPSRMLFLVAGAALGGLLGTAWLVWSVLRGLPFSSKKQLEQRFGLPVIADLSDQKGLDQAASSSWLHHMRGLRNKTIHFSAPDLDGSSGSVATKLAEFAARTGQRTVLVKFTDEDGTAKIEQTGEPNFHIHEVGSGIVADLERFNRGLAELRASYDNIFLEASEACDPVLLDYLSSHSDLDVIVVGKDKTRKNLVEQRVRELGHGGTSPVALIMVDPALLAAS